MPPLITGCTLCSLGLQDSKSNCLSSNWEVKERGQVVKPRITLVVENVSKEDDWFGENLTEKTTNTAKTGAQLVWEIIDQVGIPRDAINVVSLTRCHLKDKAAKITDEQVKACMPYLWNELRTNRPEIVVCMGLDVTKYLTGIKKLALARGLFGNFKMLKGFDPVPEDMADITVTSSAAPGSVWSQTVTGKGVGRSQLIEDLSGIWKKINGLERDARCDYAWMESWEEIDAYFTEVETLFDAGAIPGVVIDVETNQHLDPWSPTGKLVAIGFSHQPFFARAVKINHYQDKMFTEYGQPMWEAFVRRLQLLFDRVPIAGWNLKFDTNWVTVHTGAKPKEVYFDGHLAHYLVFNYDGAKHGLKDFSIDKLGSPIAEAQLHSAMAALTKAGRPKDEVHMGNVDEAILLTYLGGDVDNTVRASYYLDPMIDNDHVYMTDEYQGRFPGWNHREVYDILLDTVINFSEIEQNGIAVDKLMLAHLQDTYPAKLKALLQPILDTDWAKSILIEEGKDPKTLVTYYINMSKLLYEAAGFPAEALGFEKKTIRRAGGSVVTYFPTGKPFRVKLVEWAASQGLTQHVKLIKDIEAYKKAEKLYTSYILRMGQYIEGDSKLHTVYNLGGTATGRASTSKPSLHIIPKKSDVKKMFQSRWHAEGGLIVQCDYAQLEMRVVAAIANDATLIGIFESGEDTHRQTAAQIFKKKPEDITADERDAGKTIAFGVLYGMMADAMAWRTGLPVEVCKEKIGNFFKQFKGVAAWMDKQKKDARRRAVIKAGSGTIYYNKYTKKNELAEYEFEQFGYITNVFGRKRILRDANHWKTGWANGADRQASNTPIQGTASDIALQAVLRIHKTFKTRKLMSKLFGFIHDSIETDTHPTEFIEVLRVMKQEMEERPKQLYPWLTVPIKVSMEVGHGWGNMVEIDTFDFDTNTMTLKGTCAYHKDVCDCHESNVLSVIRALSTNYEVDVQHELPIEKNGKIVGHKAVVKLKEVVF